MCVCLGLDLWTKLVTVSFHYCHQHFYSSIITHVEFSSLNTQRKTKTIAENIHSHWRKSWNGTCKVDKYEVLSHFCRRLRVSSCILRYTQFKAHLWHKGPDKPGAKFHCCQDVTWRSTPITDYVQSWSFWITDIHYIVCWSSSKLSCLFNNIQRRLCGQIRSV